MGRIIDTAAGAAVADPQKDEISGTWKQSGQQIPLVLKKDVPKK